MTMPTKAELVRENYVLKKLISNFVQQFQVITESNSEVMVLCPVPEVACYFHEESANRKWRTLNEMWQVFLGFDPTDLSLFKLGEIDNA
jgi:hypothetical protein